MKKAVGYLRRSTDKQEQSLDDQKREILTFSKNEGFEIVGWYEDDAISGAFSETRSKFQAMIQSAQGTPRPFDLIISYDIARFSRGDNIEAGYYLYILRKAGVEVLYVKENLKGDDMDEILRPVFQFNANLYLKSLSRDTIRGQVTGARAGRFMGGPVPYGYLRVVDENGKSSLILDVPEKVKVVKRIFEDYIHRDLGYNPIANELNQEGIPAPRGGTWATSCVRSLLINPIYYGAAVWNRRTLSKFHAVKDGQAERKPRHTQQIVQKNPESDWIVKENAFPVIITKELWLTAKEKRMNKTQNPRQHNGHSRISPYLLSGLITCSNCGYPYSGTTRTNGKGLKSRTYTCGGFWSRGRAICQNYSFSSRLLEDPIIQGIRKRIDEGNLEIKLPREIKRQLEGEGQSKDEPINWDVRIKAIDKRIDLLLDTVSLENKELINRKLSQLNQERKRLEAEKATLKDRAVVETSAEQAINAILSGLKDFETIFTNEAPVGEKKQFIRRFIGAIRVSPKEKKALVGWYRMPKPSSPITMVAGAGFEPATFGL